MIIKMDWRKVVVYGTDLAMELCWLYAILSLLNKQAANGQLSLFWILLIFPLAFGFNKAIQRLAWHKFYLNILNWLAWAIVMLLTVKIQLFSNLEWSNTDWILSLPLAIPQLIYTFKPELLILVSSGVIWWLGKWLAYRSANFITSVTEFQFGLLLLVIIFTFNYILKIEHSDSIPITLIFFFCALLGTSIAHAGESKSWLNSVNKFQWSWLLLASIILILILGLIIGLALSPDLLQLVVNALKWLGRLIIQALMFIASLFPRSESTGMLPPTMNTPPMEGQDTLPWTIPESVRSWLNLGMGIMWAGLFAIALWRISSQIYDWLRTRLGNSAGTEIKPLKGAFGAELLSLLKRIINKLYKLVTLSWLVRRRGTFSSEAISVHQVYHRLLRWGAAGGYPRHISQTPDEYLATLAGLLPKIQEDMAFITQQFVGTRYGKSMPTDIELQELRQGWKRVKKNRLKKKAR